MIWVVGDIHGMFDPLKHLVKLFRDEESSGRPVEKVIFIGDLIDHGPSSREVLDLVRSLPWPAVVLLGNHEDLALNYLQGRENNWFPSNGGQATLASYGLDAEETINPRDLGFPKEIETYLENLPLRQEEHFFYGGRDNTWHFVHGGFNSLRPLALQLEPRNARELRTWIAVNSVLNAQSPLWNREAPERLGSGVVTVYGHTPTFALRSVIKDIGPYDPHSGTPYLGFDTKVSDFEISLETETINWGGDIKDLHSINIDTGAVYGGSLTALGLSSETLEKGIIPAKIVWTGAGYRGGNDACYEIRLKGNQTK